MIGWTPQQIDAISLWQFQAAINGYADAHDPDTDKGLDQQELIELSELIDIEEERDRQSLRQLN